MKVKICGITRLADALFCAQAGADMLGFIFYEKSPRAIAPEAARTIIEALPKGVTPVGVFVNAARAAIEETIRSAGVRAIQLSGDELPEDCLGYALPVIKAFRLKRPEDAVRVRDYVLSAALLDGAPEGSYGGSGLRADAAVAHAMKAFAPLMLAGGLSPDNIVEAAAAVAPYAVDVNSGVELSPGVKDPAKVALLFERLRHVNERIQ